MVSPSGGAEDNSAIQLGKRFEIPIHTRGLIRSKKKIPKEPGIEKEIVSLFLLNQ